MTIKLAPERKNTSKTKKTILTIFRIQFFLILFFPSFPVMKLNSRIPFRTEKNERSCSGQKQYVESQPFCRHFVQEIIPDNFPSRIKDYKGSHAGCQVSKRP